MWTRGESYAPGIVGATLRLGPAIQGLGSAVQCRLRGAGSERHDNQHRPVDILLGSWIVRCEVTIGADLLKVAQLKAHPHGRHDEDAQRVG